MKHYYVYKYVVGNNHVIYVGMTDDIDRRVMEHASGIGLEAKFTPYLDKTNIFYHECSNEVEMQALETLLINQYKPELNVVDIQDGESTVDISMTWTLYDHKRFLMAQYEISPELLKNIKSNETRISHYMEEEHEILKEMNRIRPFYEAIGANIDTLVTNPDSYIEVPRASLPKLKNVHVGQYVAENAFDDEKLTRTKAMVQFSGEFLALLFAVQHNDDWIDVTLEHAGLGRCREIEKRIDNLKRKNDEINRKIGVVFKSVLLGDIGQGVQVNA